MRYMTEIHRSVDVVLLSLCKKSLALMLRSRRETKLVTFVVVQSLSWVTSDSVQPHGLQHARLLSLPLSPGVCSNSCLLSHWCYLTISSSATPSPFVFNLSWHQGLFQWVDSLHQVAKVLELQLQHQSFQWIFPLGLTTLISLQSWLLHYSCSP